MMEEQDRLRWGTSIEAAASVDKQPARYADLLRSSIMWMTDSNHVSPGNRVLATEEFRFVYEICETALDNAYFIEGSSITRIPTETAWGPFRLPIFDPSEAASEEEALRTIFSKVSQQPIGSIWFGQPCCLSSRQRGFAVDEVRGVSWVFASPSPEYFDLTLIPHVEQWPISTPSWGGALMIPYVINIPITRDEFCRLESLANERTEDFSLLFIEALDPDPLLKLFSSVLEAPAITLCTDSSSVS